jgi:hypothetical protein
MNIVRGNYMYTPIPFSGKTKFSSDGAWPPGLTTLPLYSKSGIVDSVYIENADNLKTLTIPESVTYVGIFNCPHLEHILPLSLPNLDWLIIHNCAQLRNIRIQSTKHIQIDLRGLILDLVDVAGVDAAAAAKAASAEAAQAESAEAEAALAAEAAQAEARQATEARQAALTEAAHAAYAEAIEAAHATQSAQAKAAKAAQAEEAHVSLTFQNMTIGTARVRRVDKFSIDQTVTINEMIFEGISDITQIHGSVVWQHMKHMKNMKIILPDKRSTRGGFRTKRKKSLRKRKTKKS